MLMYEFDKLWDLEEDLLSLKEDMRDTLRQLLRKSITMILFCEFDKSYIQYRMLLLR